MVTLTLPDELARQLEDLARHKNSSVVEVIAELVEKERPEAEKASGWDAILGIDDASITDMSTT